MPKPKHHSAPKVQIRFKPSPVAEEHEVARLARERDEALAQQTATSEVLSVISASRGELEPVFRAMLERAVRLCGAKFGNIYRWDGEALHILASHNTPPAFAEAVRRSPYRPYPNSPIGRMVADRTVTHINDVTAEEVYVAQRDPMAASAVALGGIRTLLGVPLLNKSEMIGAFFLSRQEVRPFTDKQIALVQSFAAQAVIAIENARLLNELRQRTTDLTEALEQQTATSDVLQVISGSPGDLQPVFEAMLEKAVRICDAKFGNIYRYDGDAFSLLASHNTPSALAEARRSSPLRPDPDTPIGRMVATKTVTHVVDTAELAAGQTNVEKQDPGLATAVRLGGVRTALLVPMLREDELIGSFSVYRQEPRPFTDKQIALVTSFAAQAVIAIENARLLNELRQRTSDLTERTADLTEALEQQTATSEVLQVISSSPGDLEPVFATMLENAVRICDGKFGNIYRWDGEALYLLAAHNTPPALVDVRKKAPLRPKGNKLLQKMLEAKTAVQFGDIAQTPGYLDRTDAAAITVVEVAGARTAILVPMMKEDELIGAFGLFRGEVQPFTDKQIELVKNFAAQAIIAIENARLLNELRARTADLTERTADLTEALEQQTATSEVLQVISSSPGDLQPVFAAMLEKAVRICDAKFGEIYRWEDHALRLVATHNTPAAFAEDRGRPFRPSPNSLGGRMLATKKAVQIADMAADRSYIDRSNPAYVAAVELGGVRTVLAIPMLKDNAFTGALILWRQEICPFTDKQIALLASFAAQAVIAIENARLLNELRQRTTDLTERTGDLTEALEQQTATSEVLQVISGSPGDLQPVFASMLENAVRICDAPFGNIYRWEGEVFSLVATHNTPAAFAEARRRSPIRPGPKTIFGRIVATKTVVHGADAVAEGRDTERGIPEYDAAVELGGVRTYLAVPMLKEDELVGLFVLFRQEVRPFTDKQIELVKNFAAQAVIAIENARLLKELRERTEEVEKLNQHLEQRVADQVGEIERMGRLRRFLPPQVADLIVASGTEKQLESHRREITALFCDLRGFTGFTESADAEDVMALLRDYHATVGEKIIKYSGTLERYAGDGVMVVFNDPVPVENPALQAVLMALEVRDAIGALTETWRRWGHEIGFGIGIAHGFATLGTIGFEGRFDYAAIGTVSNVASRLCDEAKPGQILISPRVLTKVEDAVKVEPVGEFELKGIRRPLAAYSVVDLVSAKTLDAQS